jgi:hypothetical protein
MPYIVTSSIDSYGFLTGGDSDLTARIVSHSWQEPFPVVHDPIPASWEPGSLGVRPNVLRHNLLRDFVVDDPALEFFARQAVDDIRIYAKLSLDGEVLSVLQVTSMLDVVDIDKSIPSEYSWADISYPYISDTYNSVTENRIFKVPNPGVGLSVFVGSGIRRAWESEGLTGWSFDEVLS